MKNLSSYRQFHQQKLSNNRDNYTNKIQPEKVNTETNIWDNDFFNKAETHELAQVLGGINSFKPTSPSSITSRYTHSSPANFQYSLDQKCRKLLSGNRDNEGGGERKQRDGKKKTEGGTKAGFSRFDEQNSEVIGFDCCQLEPHSWVTIECFHYK